ncbi:Unannotated, partial [Lentimonas sp. CC4]
MAAQEESSAIPLPEGRSDATPLASISQR